MIGMVHPATNCSYPNHQLIILHGSPLPQPAHTLVISQSSGNHFQDFRTITFLFSIFYPNELALEALGGLDQPKEDL